MKKQNHKTVFLTLCSILIFQCSLYSQSADQKHPWWVNLGVGPSLIGSDFSMNGGMVYCYQWEKSIISARMLGLTNKNPTIQQMHPTALEYKFADYGILYGPIWQEEQWYVSVGAGIGLVRAAYETPLEITTNTSISIPLETQCFWRPTHFFGVGLYMYSTFNFEKMLTGLMISAQLGVW